MTDSVNDDLRGVSVRFQLVRLQLEVLRLAEGMFNAQILFAAHELGIFGGLSGTSRTSRQLSDVIHAEPDALERLMNAAVMLGLLEKEGDHYSNTSLADQILVPGAQGYLGNWIDLLRRRSQTWSGLAEAVRTGEPVEEPGLHLGGDSAYTEAFVMAMHDYAQLRGSDILRHVDLSGGLRLLDLGGGPGTYAVLFARRWLDLSVVVFDLPDVLPIAAKLAAEADVAERVKVKAGDYHSDGLGSGYDVVFVSDVLHQEDAEGCVTLLRKAREALKPGGQIIVQGMFLDEDKTGPRWPVIMSLNLMLIPGRGRSYTVAETMGFLRSAGFGNPTHQTMSVMNVNSLILADRD